MLKSSQLENHDMKIAVILAAHGEAETTRFMENYRVTSQTLAHASQVMPIPRTLQKTIAVTSSIKKLIRSRTNPECSPHNQITRDQVEALQHSLDQLLAKDLCLGQLGIKEYQHLQATFGFWPIFAFEFLFDIANMPKYPE